MGSLINCRHDERVALKMPMRYTDVLLSGLRWLLQHPVSFLEEALSPNEDWISGLSVSLLAISFWESR